MSRWRPDAGARLERAALELFVEQGFAETTVPQITARAGLATRTFFRHFADKREVLFAFDAELPGIVAGVMADAPSSFSPLMVIGHGLEIVATTQLDGQLDYLSIHRAVVQSDEGLRERELRKHSVLSAAIKQGFLDRGMDELTATVSAQLGVTVFNVSVDRWLDLAGSRTLSEILRETMDALKSVIAEPAPPEEGGR